ncbi:MAG: hypothetical protein R3C05_09410 [Pirellulaceae bacterium]
MTSSAVCPTRSTTTGSKILNSLVKMDEYIHLRKKARDVFEMRYPRHGRRRRESLGDVFAVLSRHDIVERLSEP